jgi:hypothetical protein
MFDFGGFRPLKVKSNGKYDCFGCGDKITEEYAVKVEFETFLCSKCSPTLKNIPRSIPYEEDIIKERKRRQEEQQKAQEAYEAKFCCKDWLKFNSKSYSCDGVTVFSDGSISAYYYADDYLNHVEELVDLGFKFCPYCQKPLQNINT